MRGVVVVSAGPAQNVPLTRFGKYPQADEPRSIDDDPYDGCDDDPFCTHCDGSPDMQECDDPIQCCDPRCDGTWHPCVACNGTGRAGDQWLW